MNKRHAIVTNPEHIRTLSMISLAQRLALEITLGSRGSTSLVQVAQRNGYTKKRTRKGALKDVIKAIQKRDPGWKPTGSMSKALKPKQD